MLPALLGLALAAFTQQAGSAQAPQTIRVPALGLVAPDTGPPNEFLLHAAPDRIEQIAARHGLTVLRALDIPPYDVFLVRAPGVTTNGLVGDTGMTMAQALVNAISGDPEVVNIEPNALAIAPEVPAGLSLDHSPVAILDALGDGTLADFGGVQVWNHYLTQPAVNAIRLPDSRSLATGAGVIVAVIDTGVDPTHPILQGSLVPGYDFVNEIGGPGSEWTGVDSSVVAILDHSPVAILDSVPVPVNQSSIVIVTPQAAAALPNVQVPAAFGHGTMVAGLVHLVAPGAKIMPLKAFHPDGTSRIFDIVRAIYFAVDHGARVINMSFSTLAWSPEVNHAINVATSQGVIVVSSAGNFGQEIVVYPAGQRNVVAVGSTNSAAPAARSAFSNWGDSLVSLGAPGAGVITTYPGGHYAGAWGTSFSTPLTAGAAALLVQIDPNTNHDKVATLLGRAEPMTPAGMGRGRLNVFEALRTVNDETAPSVAFATPSGGTVASESIVVSATASDNLGVAGVKFLLDNNPLGAEDTSAPYEVTWNTAGASNGEHVLTAVARDGAGNQASVTLGVTVSNDGAAPAVAFTSPAAGGISGTVTVAATASDDLGVTGVQFNLDGAPLATEIGSAPYEIAWDTGTVSNGAHELTVVARDAAGHTTTATLSVTVANDSAEPTVAITSPAAGSVAGNVTVAAAASDDVGVVGVQFAVDGVPLGAEDTTAPYQVTWASATTANGAHVFTAVARDAAGHTSTASVSVTVINDTGAPSVAITHPGPGTVAGILGVGATASDDIGVAGVQFTLDGAPLGAEDTTAPYEVIWDSTSAANGAHVLAAVARDAAGHTSTASVNVTVTNDTGAPTVALTSPGAGTVAGSVSVAATASDDIGVVGVQFTLNGAPLGAEDTTAPYELTWDSASVANGAHVLAAVARDAAGHTSTASVNVTVTNDTGAPTVALTSPGAGTVAGSVSVAAAASDDIGVVGVQFTLDGAPLGAEDTTAPYELTWDSASVANGAHVLAAVARDAAGHTSTASVNVTVTNDTGAPTVALTSPGAGTVAGSVSVAAAASDDIGVVGVQFTLDGAPLGAEDTTAPYELTWDSASVANGAHVLAAVARDAAGHTSTASVNVTVTNDTGAPTVAVTSPGAGTVAGSVSVAATASDDIGVVGVQFTLNGAPLGAEDTTAPYELAWDSASAANGVHVLAAVARDAAGHATTAVAVSVVVANVP